MTAIRGVCGSNLPAPSWAWKPLLPGRSLAFPISRSKLLGFTAPWSWLASKNSVLAFGPGVKKVAFDFATSTTFPLKSSLADG